MTSNTLKTKLTKFRQDCLVGCVVVEESDSFHEIDCRRFADNFSFVEVRSSGQSREDSSPIRNMQSTFQINVPMSVFRNQRQVG